MRENKRDDIIRCALALFAERGYDAVSPGDIVEAVGVKKPTLYYFFGSKDGLLEELLKTGYGELDALLAEHCKYEPNNEDYEKDVFPALVRVANAYFAYAKTHTDFYMMVLSFWFLPPASKPALMAKPYQQNQFRILEGMFEDIAAAHQNLKGKERIYAWRFLSLVNAQVGSWRRGFGTMDDATASSIVTGFMHGIFS